MVHGIQGGDGGGGGGGGGNGERVGEKYWGGGGVGGRILRNGLAIVLQWGRRCRWGWEISN